MRRLASILLVLALLLLATPAAASAGTTAFDNYEYTLNEDGSATITRYTDGFQPYLTIPEEIDGHPVTSIAAHAFRSSHLTVTLTIPDGIREIGEGAFSNCSKLERVTIGTGVTEIGSNPFYGCRSLERIEVAPGNPVLEVVGQALIYEPETRLIACPAVLTGASAAIPEGTKIIGGWALVGYAHESVVIPEGVESIEENAFQHCPNLTEVIVPDSVVSIGTEAFYGCSALERVVLGGGVRELGINPFFWCTALKDIEISPGTAEVLEVRAGALIHLPDMRMVAYLSGLPAGEYEVPEGVVAIGAQAFSKSPNLVSITVPEGVTEIGNRAFEYCPALTSVTLPDSALNLGDTLFASSSELRSVTLPEGITEIPMLTFTQCIFLTDLTIPEGVRSIGKGAFNSCHNLTLKVFKGSYAAKYAEYYKIPYEYAD